MSSRGKKPMERLISVVVPVYNIEKYIGTCIESIINQTYDNLEIILIDDGSTDNSGLLCDNYAKIDSRIKVIHKNNGGQSSARKAGIAIAQGDYISFVDGDDWIELDMYAYLAYQIQSSNADIISTGFFKEYGNSVSILCDGMEERCYYRDSGEICKHLFFNNGISNIGILPNMVTKLFRLDIAQKYFNQIQDDLTYGEDAACVYSCIPFVDTVQVIHKAFYHYRFRENSTVHSKNNKILKQMGDIFEHLLDLYKNHECYDTLKKQLSAYIVLNVFRGLNYFMDIDDMVKIPLYIVPSKVYQYGEKIALYGAGMVGQAYERQLKTSKDTELVIWVDKMFEYYKKNGMNVKDIEQLKQQKYDVILLAISDKDMMVKIKKSLVEMGIKEEKIYWEMPMSLIDQYVCI